MTRPVRRWRGIEKIPSTIFIASKNRGNETSPRKIFEKSFNEALKFSFVLACGLFRHAAEFGQPFG